MCLCVLLLSLCEEVIYACTNYCDFLLALNCQLMYRIPVLNTCLKVRKYQEFIIFIYRDSPHHASLICMESDCREEETPLLRCCMLLLCLTWFMHVPSANRGRLPWLTFIHQGCSGSMYPHPRPSPSLPTVPHLLASLLSSSHSATSLPLYLFILNPP